MRMVIDTFLLCALLFLCGIVFSERAERLEKEHAEMVAKQVDPNAVYKQVYDRIFRLTNGQVFVGSGFVLEYKSSRFMVTAAHVCIVNVDGTLSISDDKSRTYKILSMDLTNDVCLLQSPDKPGLTAAMVPAQQFEKIFTIGNPFGQDMIMTEGRAMKVIPLNDIAEYTDTSMRVGPGSSGGPVFNQSGQVIGLVVNYHSNTTNGGYVDRRKIMDLIDIELQYFPEGRGN